MPQRRYLSPGGPAFDGTNSSSGDALEPKSSSRARGPGTPEAAPDQPPPGRGRTGPGDGAGSVSETRTQRPCRSAPDPCQPQGWLKAFVLPVGSSLPSSCRPGALSPGGLCKRRSLGVAQCLTRQVWGKEREGTFLPGPRGLGEPLEKHGPRRWARSPGCSTRGSKTTPTPFRIPDPDARRAWGTALACLKPPGLQGRPSWGATAQFLVHQTSIQTPLRKASPDSPTWGHSFRKPPRPLPAWALPGGQAGPRPGGALVQWAARPDRVRAS